MSKFSGTGVAMVTPFKDNGEVDVVGLENLTNHLIDGGVEYLVVQGTTGESATLTKVEKQEVLDCVVDVSEGRLPIVYGHGGNNTRALIDAFDEIDLSSVDAILSASPYYNKPTQPGIIKHYQALADASPLPIILYNVPGRTSSNMASTTTLTLAEHDKIIAVKEASGDLDQVGAIIKRRPEGFLVLSGDDPLIVPHMSLGGDGIITVIGNAFPRQFSDIARACANGDYAKARRLHYLLIDFIYLLFAEGNPGGIKAALEILGVCGQTVRLPLAEVSKDLYKKLQDAIETIQQSSDA